MKRMTDWTIANGFARCAAVLLLFGVAACAGDERYGSPETGYLENAQEIVSAADWSKPEKITVILSEFSFSPDALTFRAGQTYALKLFNPDPISHNFTSSTFFRAIAAYRLTMSDGEADMPVLESISLDSKETKILYFVAARPGSYALKCDVTLHATFGMTGEIAIR
jgi:uncharacterized cupredoxin-like copper-binding protein